MPTQTIQTKKPHDPQDFDIIKLTLASPEKIQEWSFGEVTKPETINYRTQRSEKSGLFDERIFGPDRDYECYCGKYRGIRYKGIVCEKCGVEITRSIVRRERMGHIELATPVSHVWFLRSVPSRISLVLGMTSADLERVVYFAGYIVTKVHEQEKTKFLKELDGEYKVKVKTAQDDKTKEALKELLLSARREIETITPGFVMDEVAYHKYALKYGSLFESGIGAEAIYEILKKIDMPKLKEELEKTYEASGAAERERIAKRLSLVKQMIKADLRPEWMFLTKIPVIPPGLRPMVALDGGRFATSDVNDLYRRVINRNNRLLKLREINAPEVILRNEKRILQEAVDALIDNSIRHSSSAGAAAIAAQKRALKSLSDSLKSKRGLFRQNLLGKRVDYSGRSVIVVGPELRLDQCGLPKHMALELFRPFVISGLLKRELAYNIRGANRLIDDGAKEVWEILEEVIKGKYVLLNRAPTLHRLGIQAFQPILIEGNAIQVHPLVCTAFNADFDGDQMAVHIPLSAEAQLEAKEIMASDKNILKPGNNDPTVVAKMLDIVLGCFWVTKAVPKADGNARYFESPEAAVRAYDFNVVGLREPVKIMTPKNDKYAQFSEQLLETTVGRILFNAVLPEDYPFVNEEVGRKRLGATIDDMIALHGAENISPILDKIKNFGFGYTTYSGTTWGIDDIKIPESKDKIIAGAKRLANLTTEQFNEGLLTEEERIRKHIEIWQKAKSEVEKSIPPSLDKMGSVYDMITSGARGSLSQITQMAGMKGLISSVSGATIEFPILSCSKEGLTPIEYFITTHGSRKGLTDTALNTAKAGYLTRKLFVVAQDVVVSEGDCGTKESIVIRRQTASGMNIPLSKSVRGRVLAETVKNSAGETLFEKGHLITKSDAQKIEDAEISDVRVRSPLSCKTPRGVCAQCYGLDLGKNRLVELGEAVGTVAAQAIGEPGTQLTMRTFHAGGTASQGGDITAGLPRVEEIFEKRRPKTPAVVATVDGVVVEVKDMGREKLIRVLPELEGQGKKKPSEVEYIFPYRRTTLVRVGDRVRKGDLLTDGSADIDEVFNHGGEERAKDYVITEVGKIYELQGETVSRKHIEIIVKQMFSRRRVIDGGGTNLNEGMIVDDEQLSRENAAAKAKDGNPAKVEKVVMGITETSLTRQSFLSAASFQHTTRVLIANAVRAAEDDLKGLMENVIIGRLVPAGTGFDGSPKQEMIRAGAPKEVIED
ncbi:DNA-directed RNA polymerase subunit beta' [Patescibacteria group bacterium]|nr:DNA-directed RNA polymerase subunit beta' [Patescibacteria group bacterium]MDE1946779.1 DNA-directed RNA polymerase subunit beta' [Patescibacteria group bacterium]MDE2011089.1 DNA-directed RNA polymerase subunit beta' [Patescibacteria group bacterium]MDE2233146.1 DNA-directed RNA polymerase subunit beta' [Patescibacteria group bacterium]